MTDAYDKYNAMVIEKALMSNKKCDLNNFILSYILTVHI